LCKVPFGGNGGEFSGRWLATSAAGIGAGLAALNQEIEGGRADSDGSAQADDWEVAG